MGAQACKKVRIRQHRKEPEQIKSPEARKIMFEDEEEGNIPIEETAERLTEDLKSEEEKESEKEEEEKIEEKFEEDEMKIEEEILPDQKIEEKEIKKHPPATPELKEKEKVPFDTRKEEEEILAEPKIQILPKQKEEAKMKEQQKIVKAKPFKEKEKKKPEIKKQISLKREKKIEEKKTDLDKYMSAQGKVQERAPKRKITEPDEVSQSTVSTPLATPRKIVERKEPIIEEKKTLDTSPYPPRKKVSPPKISPASVRRGAIPVSPSADVGRINRKCVMMYVNQTVKNLSHVCGCEISYDHNPRECIICSSIDLSDVPIL